MLPSEAVRKDSIRAYTDFTTSFCSSSKPREDAGGGHPRLGPKQASTASACTTGCESTRGQWHRVRLTEKYGRVFPSLEGLAHLSMCCRQSVVTAIADLERLGFVTRIRRIRRIMTPFGFVTQQITNAYRVHEPASGLGLLATLVFATESWTASAHIVESLN